MNTPFPGMGPDLADPSLWPDVHKGLNAATVNTGGGSPIAPGSRTISP